MWGDLEAALNELMQLFQRDPTGTFSPPTPSGPNAVNPALLPPGIDPSQIVGVSGAPGAPGTPGGTDWLSKILQIINATSGAQYGGNELDAIKNIYNQQKQAERMAMGVQPGNLANEVAMMTRPLDRNLKYQVTQAADQASAARGMGQSAGAMAAGESAALAPFVQQNQGLGAELAVNANELALRRLDPAFEMTPPNYLSVLSDLGTLGRSQTGPYDMGASS